MSAPQWTWELLDGREAPVDRPLSPAFVSRFDAEAWLGEHWRELAGSGVAAARLLHKGLAAAPALPLRAG